MKHGLLITIAFVLVVLSGCKPMDATPSFMDKQETTNSPLVDKAAPATVVDVEFQTWIKGELDDRSRTAYVTAEELINARSVLDLTTITVKPPCPAELWVTFTVETQVDVSKAPLLLRVNIKQDQNPEPVAKFFRVLNDSSKRFSEPFALDLMKLISGTPDSVLLYAQAEVLLLDEGTDFSTFDPEKVAVPKEHRGTIQGNPIRINFVKAESAPAPVAAPVVAPEQTPAATPPPAAEQAPALTPVPAPAAAPDQAATPAGQGSGS